ncbi:hypothetical protein BJ322DRAFT_1113799 [Thelephora terrestris]|uniref:HNH nuclease domain-containing protein n=1 Tax=Thelephora terrestris TaxID=56493 RepID=A0A9P6H3W4_9AGAM|nr:hypothetical protein BJ322DRAFT_1113799 [Thelephora terrestris]
MILNAEYHANLQVEANPSRKDAKDNVIFARVAGYLLLELYGRRMTLSDEPASSLVSQLLSRSEEGKCGHDVVFEVGKWHHDYLLRRFRASTTKYPTPSSHPSRPSIDTWKDMTRDCMMADGKDYWTARRKALARDSFRRLLIGSFDRTSIQRSRELRQICLDLGTTSVTVHACHIWNESRIQGINPLEGSEKSQNGIHNLGNILSLESNVHQYFEKLELWFEGTNEPNRYHVLHVRYLRKFEHLHADGDHTFVTFSPSPHYEGARLPNPQLLALHAACARVAHMSGAAEAFDELEREVEETNLLASDGSSAYPLDHLMSLFATIPGVA